MAREVELSLVIGCRATLGCAIHDKEPGVFAGVYHGVRSWGRCASDSFAELSGAKLHFSAFRDGDG